MIAIGRLNKEVHLQSVTRTTTANGVEEAWVTYATVRAAIEPATPARAERLLVATIQAAVSHFVTIWFRPSRTRREDAPGSYGQIHPSDRVLFGERALYIAGIQNVMEANRQLILACEERAA
jgi:head-tail adaptor